MTELTCYTADSWGEVIIRPSPVRRDWMDANDHSYRCLPLSMANSHGWEMLNSSGFTVIWDGRQTLDALTFVHDDPDRATHATSRFGSGIVTFHVPGLFRTSQNWNLWISGRPNEFKDGAAPLTGLVETDWLPYTFTMNWKLTRIGHPVRWEKGEPFCHIFPVPRGALDDIEPKVKPLQAEEGLVEKLDELSRKREVFINDKTRGPKDSWQKYYYTAANKLKNRLKEFTRL